MSFIKIQDFKKNGMIETKIFKSESAYDKYITDGKNLESKYVLSRDSAKEALRAYFVNNAKKVCKRHITVSYLTNVGVHYVDIGETPDELDNYFLNKVLMRDPVEKQGPSDSSNASMLTGPNTRIYGVTVISMPIDYKKTDKKETVVVQNNKPKLTAPSLDWD